MTTLVDPRPYAGPGDLVTAADVARWLESRDRGSKAAGWRIVRLSTVVTDLRARLERERRQACRRGALACWRRFAGEARENRHPHYRDSYTALVWGDKPTDLYRIGQDARKNLADALAFRAAARQP